MSPQKYIFIFKRKAQEKEEQKRAEANHGNDAAVDGVNESEVNLQDGQSTAEQSVTSVNDNKSKSLLNADKQHSKLTVISEKVEPVPSNARVGKKGK